MKCLYCVAVLGIWLGAGGQIWAAGLLATAAPTTASRMSLPLANAGTGPEFPLHLAFEQAGNAKRQEPTMASDSADTLQGEPWNITSSAFSDMLPDSPATVTFNEDSIRLEAPCNTYTTKIQLGAGTIVVFPFESMPKTCGPEAMEVEGALLRAFVRASRFSITADGELVLNAPDGAEMIRARR